jgi:predicted nucleotide-binding protein
MSSSQTVLAKLAGILKSIKTLLDETSSGVYRNRPMGNFNPNDVKKYFDLAGLQLTKLKQALPDLYEDFFDFDLEPNVKMAGDADFPYYFGRNQLKSLMRDIEQVFELRASSELAVPMEANPVRIFISHGSANDWNQVQNFIEKDLEISTLELAQEASRGRTILQKLEDEASRCSFAVIVMTGDDQDSEGKPKTRENVMHEIGYFQGKFGLSAVCLLHEEGTNIPSNIHGLVYVPFPKGYVNATFSTLMREIQAYYKSSNVNA